MSGRKATIGGVLAVLIAVAVWLIVTREEPLPPDSPLWDLPNIVITPHQSGEGPRGQERLDALFLENLRRYVVGDEMRNRITEADL